jgi:hypothetical protein
MAGERIEFFELMEQQYEKRRPALAGAQTRADNVQMKALQADHPGVEGYVVDDPMQPLRRLEELHDGFKL